MGDLERDLGVGFGERCVGAGDRERLGLVFVAIVVAGLVGEVILGFLGGDGLFLDVEAARLADGFAVDFFFCGGAATCQCLSRTRLYWLRCDC